MHACTIIAKNYIAQARVLARSLLEHNPGSRFSVLIIDGLDGLVDPAVEPFTVLTPDEIDCEPFPRMAARYDVLELSTAVKPWLLRHQLRAGAPAITYLDPDIQVFGSLEELDRRARAHGLVLTPHNTLPIPHDGERPTQIDIMIAGVYNLGCVAVGQSDEIEALIDWWSERLTRDCRVDPVYGYFVDQRWFDLAPGFVSEYSIVREPEYNVAYWNVYSRKLERSEDRYTVDGRPLAFFHFSGFDPTKPNVLSAHQSRVDLATEPVLAQICVEYARAVLAEDYAEARHWPYTYDRLADGTKMTRPLRLLYTRGEEDGSLSDSPFGQPGCERFMAWAGEQQDGAPPGVNRALAAAYGTRVDLRTAFPDLNGAGSENFLRWAHERGCEELELPQRLLTAPSAANGSRPALPRETPPPWGVNVVGYFRSELGVGEAARQAVSALDACGVPLLAVHGSTIPLNRQGHYFRHLNHAEGRYPVNLICMNADALPEFAEQAGAKFFADRYSIGLWFWEVTAPPPDGWRDAFEYLDEVWVPTRHVAEAVSPIAPVPVIQVAIPIEMPPTSALPRATFGLPEDYLFLFSFDYLSVSARKNPLAVVRAFSQAFEPGAGAALAIKCINHEHDRESHARLLEAIGERADIYVLDSYLDPWLKNALTASCDCYVSLHRSEGFGLTMAEAMYLGKPVIATGYSGNLDFMTHANGYLVDYELVEIGPGAGPYPPGGVWAEPDVEHAGRLMRGVFEDRDESIRRGRRAAEEVRRSHSPAAAGERMARRLDSLRHQHGAHPRPMTVAPALPSQVQMGPMSPPRSALGPIGPALRRLVLRLMKPFTAYQTTLNRSVLDSLESLSEQLIQFGDAQQRSESAELAHARMIGARLDRLFHDADMLKQRVDRIETEERAIPYMSEGPFQRSRHPIAGIVDGYDAASNPAGPDTYRSFEDRFRGSEQFIRERQRAFIALIGDRRPVLDFGCGRGEFMDLLRERGDPYMGVDSDPGMIARCRAKGHEQVVLADGIEYLEGLEPGELGAIFAAQVIEHLPYVDLLRFLALAHRSLGPDGLLIAETVNPHSPPALKTFWVDLTHQHPIFPEVALALCQSSGFAQAFVFHPNGVGDVGVDRFTQGEYAVVASTGGIGVHDRPVRRALGSG
jgi:glycosyltransferase involved in cell wall biosynthesis/SAM-dependent methyltransferase